MSHQEQSRLEGFWRWWWPSILSWLPGNASDRLDRAPTYRFLNWNGEDLEAAGQPEEDQAAGSIIVLPNRMALVRSLRLPLSARARLQDIAAFEVDRQTPFSTATAYHIAAPRGAIQPAATSFEASLIVVPKHVLEAAVNEARTSIVRLLGVDVMGADGHRLGVNLLPVAQRFQPPIKWQRWNGALVAISLLALFGIAFSTLQSRQRALLDLERRFQPLQAQAEETRRREELLEQVNALAASRTHQSPPTALELLTELSKRLPVDSHLLQVRLQDGVISIRGRTRNLGGVLQGLSASTHWEDPKLSGSRTLTNGGEQEFSLSLALKRSAAGSVR